MIRGLDVSGYQKDADFEKVEAGRDGYRCSFLMVKIRQGNLGVSNSALPQAKRAREAGIADVCWYVFAEPNGPDWLADARDEAKKACDFADAIEAQLSFAKKATLFVDLEPLPNQPYPGAEEFAHWREWTAEFRKTVEATGRKLGVYGSPSFLSQIKLDASFGDTTTDDILNPDQVARNPLWLAAYPATFFIDANGWPHPPAPFREVLVWQDGGGMRKPYGNEATWPGIASYADVNCFNGTIGGFRRFVSNCTEEAA